MRYAAFQSRVLNHLRTMEGGIATRAELVELLFPDPDQEPDCAEWIVGIVISLLRKNGFPIMTEHGRGIYFRPCTEILTSGDLKAA